MILRCMIVVDGDVAERLVRTNFNNQNTIAIHYTRGEAAAAEATAAPVSTISAASERLDLIRIQCRRGVSLQHDGGQRLPGSVTREPVSGSPILLAGTVVLDEDAGTVCGVDYIVFDSGFLHEEQRNSCGKLPALSPAQAAVVLDANIVRGIGGIHAVNYNVVFPVEISVVVTDKNVMTVFHVDSVFANAAAPVAQDLSIGRMPNRDSVLSRWAECVAFKQKMGDAADEVDAPVVQMFGIRDEMIVEDSKPCDGSSLGIGINSSRGIPA
jgi:hypothetical protein